MSDYALRRWDFAGDGPLTEAVIRRLWRPPERYRVTVHRYAPNHQVWHRMISALVYCMGGSGQVGDPSVRLTVGDIVRLPEGSFTATADDVEFVVIYVWELPEFIWRHLIDDSSGPSESRG